MTGEGGVHLDSYNDLTGGKIKTSQGKYYTLNAYYFAITNINMRLLLSSPHVFNINAALR